MGEPHRVCEGESMFDIAPTSAEFCEWRQGEVCVRQYWWSVKTFMLPITWVVGFNGEGVVVVKFRLD
jgi:hypothetical protein